MPEYPGIGRLLMVAGAVLFVIGLVVTLGPKIPFLGRLPGDIAIERKGFSFHFPVVTCIVVSILATLVLSFFSRR